jgi:ferredoxin-NADP reductase
MVKQYSLCGDIYDKSYYRVGILNDPNSRGGSKFVHEEIKQGDTISVRGPRNHFPLVKTTKYLFIGGGIGITPLIPMIQAVAEIGAEWRLIYGGATEHTMAFTEQLANYGDRVEFFPADTSGFLPLDLELATPHGDQHIYTCGPEPLINAVETVSNKFNWHDDNIHSERFAAVEVAAPYNALDSFEVVCEKSNVTIQVGPDETILDAIEAKGIKVLASCRAGVCGTCEIDIIEGEADHRDNVLTKAEHESNEFMLVCCSRSLSKKLILDI